VIQNHSNWICCCAPIRAFG